MAEDTRTRQFTLMQAGVTKGTGVPLLLPRGVPGGPARTLTPLSSPLHPLQAVRGEMESVALSCHSTHGGDFGTPLDHATTEALSQPHRQVEGSTVSSDLLSLILCWEH